MREVAAGTARRRPQAGSHESATWSPPRRRSPRGRPPPRPRRPRGRARPGSASRRCRRSRSGRSGTRRSRAGARAPRAPGAGRARARPPRGDRRSQAGVRLIARSTALEPAQLLERDVAAHQVAGSTSTSGGSVVSQIAPSLRGQRVWKTQPEGGSAALGISPSSRIRSRRSPSIVGHGREQRLGVRVVRPGEDGLGGAELHQPAEVEHGDAVGQVAHDAEVVRDEEVRDALARCSSTSRLRIAACTDTSSAEVGSSQTTTSGSPANARAIATRCFRPPESCVGRSARCRSASLHRADQLQQPRLQRLAVAAPPAASARGPRAGARVCRRLSAESGFWKTIWSALTCSRVRSRASPATAAPSSSTADPGSGSVDAEQRRARTSSCRCPTRRRGRASRRARCSRSTSDERVHGARRSCVNVFETPSTLSTGTAASGRRAGAACRPGVSRGSAWACSW